MLLTQEKLEQIYAYYKDIESVQPIEEYRKRLSYSLRHTNMIRYRFFSYLVDALGFNALPNVVSDIQFSRVPTRTLYRGTPDINNHANLLVDFDYHKGCGVQGSGLYASDSYWHANEYANEIKDFVLKFKLCPSTKVIHFNKMHQIECALLGDFETQSGYAIDDQGIRAGINDTAIKNYKTLVDFCRAHKNDMGFEKFILGNFDNFDSNIALFLGYDAFVAGNFVVLNRGKIIVSESEFNRITSMSKNYKGGVINFEEKQDNEFLRE